MMSNIYNEFCKLRDQRRHGEEAPEHTEKRAFELALAALATDRVLAISAREKLLRAHDALEGMADTDLDHFENEEEEIEAVPAQYAARTIFSAIDDLDALMASLNFSVPPASIEGAL